VVRIGYSRLGPKHRLAAWVDLLMLAASRPEVAWEADVVGSGGSAGPQRSRLGPVQQETALAVLAELVDLRDRGLRAPLPLPLKTANAWAETPGDDWTRGRAAERSWRTDRFPGEQDDDHHVLVWGAGLPLRPDSSLPVEQQRGLLQPADPDLSWNGQSTGLGQHALRLWGPLLDHERTGPA
jgi:exodeoxyribonuclease V gamma subunit